MQKCSVLTLWRGTQAPPYMIENCRAGPMWPAAIDADAPTFQTISGSGAEVETILHLMPLAKHSQPCGMHYNNYSMFGARGGSPETIRFLAAFLGTFLSPEKERYPPEAQTPKTPPTPAHLQKSAPAHPPSARSPAVPFRSPAPPRRRACAGSCPRRRRAQSAARRPRCR